MMRDYIYDKDGELVNDPERSRIVGGRWKSHWPKGYGTFTGQVHREILREWPIKTGYRLVRRDGQRTVYDGRLQAPKQSRFNGSDVIDLTAQGWYSVLAERTIRKRWIDIEAVNRLLWPAGSALNENQTAPLVEKRDKDQFLRVSIRPKDTDLVTLNSYQEQYTTPTGAIHKVTYNYMFRTGEGLDLIIYSDDQTAIENTLTVAFATPSGGVLNHTFTQGDTGSFTLRIQPSVDDVYDQNDWASINNMVVYMEYASGHSVATPTYAIDELIEDVLLLSKGSDISADMSQIGALATVLDSFVSQDDGFETADSLIQRLAAYSDSSQNTWGLSIYGGDGSSDGLPQAVFESRDVSDYDYEVRASDCIDITIEETEREIFNWITVKWRDEEGRVSYLSPDQDGDLKDDDSIARYGQRHNKTLDAGEASEDQAKLQAQRYLAYHKDPLLKGSLKLRGFVRRKSGVYEPASWFKAGSRVRFVDMDRTFFIREADYDSDSDTLTIQPDLPEDNLIQSH
jgi:hypothetical protein